MITEKNQPTIFLNPLKRTFCLILMAFAAGCNFTPTNTANQPVANNAIIVDSLKQSGNSKLDSLLRLTAIAKQDTNLAILYNDIGDIYVNYDYEKAKEYYLKLGALSGQLDWNKGRYLSAAGYTDILNNEGLTDSSLVINQQVLELAKKEMNEEWIAKISTNIGNCYYYKKWFETALEYYNKALPLFDKLGAKISLAHLYYLMGVVYGNMNMYDEQMMYSEKALDILNEEPNALIRAYALINYAFALGKNNDTEFEKVENSLLEAQRISKLYDNRYNLVSIYSIMGEIALKKYDLNNAETYSLKCLEIALEFGDVEGVCVSNLGLGYVEIYKGNFDESEEYVRKAMKTANENDLPTEKKECYTLLADLSTARHDFHNTNFYKAKVDSIQLTLISEHTREYAKEMEAKYETEKKELQIAALEKEKRLMTGLGIAGSIVLLFALATFFLLWRWTVQKRRVTEKQQQLAEQQVKQLEQEKQLIAKQALLDGETRERTRIARDLHDGLGSILTGAKLSLLDVKKGITLDTADVKRFDSAIGLLDQSVQEMRRVAHHLMPDSLSRFGLKPAVSDFCSNLPTVRFAYYGDESRLDPNLEVMIYRSIHELVNNALRHAKADNIMVQIMQESDRIAFTVQDDGCGFDPSAAVTGMGLQNIRTRIASYNGIINIDSRTGEGTEIHAELTLNL